MGTNLLAISDSKSISVLWQMILKKCYMFNNNCMADTDKTTLS